MTATWSDSAKRSLISCQIGAPVHIDCPKSRRATPQIHVANCRQTGLSRPIRARSWSSSCCDRSEEHTSELQSHSDLVCRLLLEKQNEETLDRNLLVSNHPL